MGHYNDICSRIYFEIPFGLRDYMISAKMEVDDYGVFGLHNRGLYGELQR